MLSARIDDRQKSGDRKILAFCVGKQSIEVRILLFNRFHGALGNLARLLITTVATAFGDELEVLQYQQRNAGLKFTMRLCQTFDKVLLRRLIAEDVHHVFDKPSKLGSILGNGIGFNHHTDDSFLAPKDRSTKHILDHHYLLTFSREHKGKEPKILEKRIRLYYISNGLASILAPDSNNQCATKTV